MGKKILIIFCIIALAAIGAVTYVFLHMHVDNKAYPYESRAEALEQGGEKTAEETAYDNVIWKKLKSFDDEDSVYYLIKICSGKGSDIHQDRVYIAAVREDPKDRGRYKFEKVSEMVSVDENDGNNNLIKDNDYSTGQIKVENEKKETIYFSFGKIYNDTYVAMYKGKKLKVDKDGIVAAVKKNKKPKIVFYHDEINEYL